MVMMMEKAMNLNIYHWKAFRLKNRGKCENLMNSWSLMGQYQNIKRPREIL